MWKTGDPRQAARGLQIDTLVECISVGSEKFDLVLSGLGQGPEEGEYGPAVVSRGAAGAGHALFRRPNHSEIIRLIISGRVGRSSSSLRAVSIA